VSDEDLVIVDGLLISRKGVEKAAIRALCLDDSDDDSDDHKSPLASEISDVNGKDERYMDGALEKIQPAFPIVQEIKRKEVAKVP
jgi:hypothetical protein